MARSWLVLPDLDKILVRSWQILQSLSEILVRSWLILQSLGKILVRSWLILQDLAKILFPTNLGKILERNHLSKSWQDLNHGRSYKVLARSWLDHGWSFKVSWQDLAKICRKQDPGKILPRSYKIRQDLAKMFNLGSMYNHILVPSNICLQYKFTTYSRHIHQLSYRHKYFTGNIVPKALAKWYSQLKQTQAKLQNQNFHRQVAKRYRQVDPALKKLFNCLNSTACHITITKQLGDSSLENGSGGQTVENLARVGRKFEFDQIQANLIQLEPTQVKWVAQRYPTPSKLWTWLELAWVGRTVWPGLKTYTKLHPRPIWLQ